MSKNLTVPLASEPISTAVPATWLRSAGIVLAGSALVAACAHVALPLDFTPVPLTMQIFAVLLLGLLLTPRLAGVTLAAYVAEGALGLPVFAPGTMGSGGVMHLFGPTGGYLLCYPAAAAMVSWLWRRRRRSFAAAMFSAAAGDLAILACGALWLAAFTHLSALPSITLAVLPFLPGDALQIAAAAAVAVGWLRLRRRAVYGIFGNTGND